ncbi:MAG: hypothetical protein C4525_09365 [Desulfarculus sp.]|nr:MAG: hypothetical protein C4525_09365 [Desulfarculus sp.]
MEDSQSLSHSVWECKYRLVWIPKYRRKALYDQMHRHLGEVFRPSPSRWCMRIAASWMRSSCELLDRLYLLLMLLLVYPGLLQGFGRHVPAGHGPLVVLFGQHRAH